jgi:hypothetical protein
MLKSRDFKELLSTLARHRVRYLVIGGYAVMRYAEPRYTKDLDLWIATDPLNATAIFTALREFGAPLLNLSEKDFMEPGYFYQMGRPPLRVDIMMSIPGLEFESAWRNREEVSIDELSVPFISKQDLIGAKLASGRPEDLLDVERLRQTDTLS